MRPRSPRPVTNKERRKNRRRVKSKLKVELSVVSTATEVQGQEMIMIMKYVNLTVQGERAVRQGQSEQGQDRESTTAVHCETHHRESCSQNRSIQEPMQLSSRGKQMVWPSGGHNYREHRERDSRAREHQLGHGIWALTAGANGSILAEGNRHTGHEHHRGSSHRDRCGSFSSAADGRSRISSRRPSRSSSRQHSMMSNLLRVKQISIGVNKIDSGTAGSKQEKCDEISNEMKIMLIKICWKMDIIEKNTRPAEAVGATK